MLVLGAIALFLVGALFSLDHYLVDTGFSDPVTHYLSFSPDAVSNSIGVLSSIVAAVLGIIITVVSIVVQLSATRYTPAITEMFFRDRTNLAVMALYVVGCVMGFWFAFGVNDGWVPRVSLLVMLSMATLGFLLMAPYFAYVFRFLSPQAVVARIEGEVRSAALDEARRRPRDLAERQQQILVGVEQLTDIAINSISQKDRIIAIACVDAMRELLTGYIDQKKNIPPAWLTLRRDVERNTDFSSMSRDSLSDLENQGTWFEFKLLRQYQAIYSEALGNARSINYVIAINTRLVAERALEMRETATLKLSIKFFNTYLRATINHRDVRTAYTILKHYRLLAEAALGAGEGELALQMAKHIKYYGHLSYHKRLGFVTETVAYDLGALCESAHELGADIEARLLLLFLDIDPATSEGEIQELSLRGVRKAQLKLATFYLDKGAETLARQVWEDVRCETPDRLRSIFDELLAVESADFWEISDRGGNFDYLPPERKAALAVFLRRFEAAHGQTTAAPTASSRASAPPVPAGDLATETPPVD